MGNWAIVIGIDQYWKADANLRGAVSDALKIRAWLLDPNGGQVASDKLALFLAPMHPSVPCRLASHLDIYDYINWLVNIKQAQGERLFFYFSGHGMAAPMTTTYVDALLPTDFTDLRTHLSFQLDKLLEYFQTSKFMDQFFFIDACRNIPWAGQLCAVGNPFLRGLDPKLPAVQQFVFRATSPGIGAAEISQAGSERGAFTEVLLEGLTHGKGQAKVYDSARGDYVVRVGKLFEFVKKKVSETRSILTDPARRLLQVPQLTGPRGVIGRDSDPELARFAEHTTPDEHLVVDVEPTAVMSDSVLAIMVKRDGMVKRRTDNVTQLPVEWDLPQRDYEVSAEAAGYERKARLWPVAELYEPQHKTVTLVRTPSTPSLPPSGPPGGAGHATAGASGSTQLIVHSRDALAPLEVEHSTGTVLKVGQGSLDCLNLDPGFYRARCRTPENEVEEQTIGLSAGASESVQLDAPDVPYTRLVRNAIKVANGRIHSDRTIEFAGVGSVAAAHISTIVTLAGSVANGPTTFNAPGLRRLGAWAFRDKVPQDMSGVYLLFAADVATNKDTLDYISKVEVRLWPQSGTRPGTFDRLAPFSRAAGLAQLVQGAYPGSYWLELTLPERPAVAFALNILDGRLTMLVVSRELAGQIHVFQYLPSLAPSGFLRPDQMRQLELFQRFYLSGQLEHAAQIASQILKDGWGDPISECLAGYLLLRRGDNASLGVFDQFMMTRPYHNKMSDSYVLHAEYEARQGDDAQAESIYRTAINQGLPIIVDGLRRLADGVQRYHIQNPSADWITNVYRNRVGSWLWSAVS